MVTTRPIVISLRCGVVLYFPLYENKVLISKAFSFYSNLVKSTLKNKIIKNKTNENYKKETAL